MADGDDFIMTTNGWLIDNVLRTARLYGQCARNMTNLDGGPHAPSISPRFFPHLYHGSHAIFL